jgi:hypothetical protein
VSERWVAERPRIELRLGDVPQEVGTLGFEDDVALLVGVEPELPGALPLVANPPLEGVVPAAERLAHRPLQRLEGLVGRPPDVPLADAVEVALPAVGVHEVSELRELCAGELRGPVDDRLAPPGEHHDPLAILRLLPVARVPDHGIGLDVERVDLPRLGQPRESLVGLGLGTAERRGDLRRRHERSGPVLEHVVEPVDREVGPGLALVPPGVGYRRAVGPRLPVGVVRWRLVGGGVRIDAGGLVCVCHWTPVGRERTKGA